MSIFLLQFQPETGAWRKVGSGNWGFGINNHETLSYSKIDQMDTLQDHGRGDVCGDCGGY